MARVNVGTTTTASLKNGFSWEDINEINDFSRELPYD